MRRSFFKLGLLAVFFGLLNELAGQEITTTKTALKIDSKEFANLYNIDDQLFRSEQPDNAGMKELEQMGIKTVLNLRNCKNDNREAKGTTIIVRHLPINTWTISYKDIKEALIIINSAEKPVLVHCLHGSDRTGCVVAAYRMVFNNWSKEDAIQEFKDEKFGYHENMFPNLVNLLESIDVESLKTEVKF